MGLAPGTRLGPYEVVSMVGAGGMGEVYRARDIRLDRTVAIKVLPPQLATDPQFRERFEREARSISQVTHPHICTLHDVGDADHTAFLVMEYLEGETLAERLKNGPLPIDEAVDHALEIASALQAAHRHGIIHRDLKPANIMLTRAGAKLLDFGLAKPQPTAAASRASALTEVPPLTRNGTLLGTPQYMAPEQIEGNDVDARTDIFAFGSVLFEMLTGRKPFEGHSHPSLISAILKDEPPRISTLQPAASPALDRLIRACLEKNRDERWESAGDLERALKWIREEEQAQPSPATVRNRRRIPLWAAIIASALVSSTLGILAARRLGTPVGRAVARLTIDLPDSPVGTTSFPLTQISPDGRRVAFIISGGRADLNDRRIWLRDIDGRRADPIAGTETASGLFWSPNSEQLAFMTLSSVLKKVTVSTRTIETLCVGCTPTMGGGTWSRNGLLVFPSVDGLLAVRESGGQPEVLTKIDRGGGEIAHISPHFLPDGNKLLYVVRHADPARSGLYVRELGAGAPKLLLPGEHPAIYAPPGYLLFNQAGNIVARPFNAQRLEFSEAVTPVVAPPDYQPTPVQGGDIAFLQSSGLWPNFSVSETGVLAYAIAEHPETQFRWVSRGGELLELVETPGLYQTFDLSSDGSRLVFSRLSGEHASLWIRDASRRVTSRLTFGASSYYDPRWGPKGAWLLASRPVPPPLAIVSILADGRQSVLPGFGEPCILDDVSPDGRYLLCRPAGLNLMAMPVGDTGDPILIRRPPNGYIDQAEFSPDGRWIAYNADESGRLEIYMTAFPPSAERWQVSVGGGVQPVWRQDARELYYLGLDGSLKAVDLRLGDRPRFSAPKQLFDSGLAAPSPWVEQYTASADGQRFLILKPVEDRVRNSIGFILNWPTLLPAGD